MQHKLHDVLQIKAARSAFAALREDGVVVSWGCLYAGSSDSMASSSESDSSVVNEVTVKSIQNQLRDVRQIQARRSASAAIQEDGSVITWGALEAGGDLTPLPKTILSPPP